MTETVDGWVLLDGRRGHVGNRVHNFVRVEFCIQAWRSCLLEIGRKKPLEHPENI